MTEDFNRMNRELGEMKATLEANHEVHLENRDDIKKILEQTTKTNGRVTKLEDFVEGQYKLNSKWDGQFLKQWDEIETQKQKYNYGLGILKALGIVGTIVLIIGGYLFTLVVKDIIHKDLNETLASYDITIQK